MEESNFDPAATKGAHGVEHGPSGMGELASFRLFEKGESLFAEGDRGSEAYVLKTGKVRIVQGAGANEHEIGIEGAGAIIGEMAVISDMPRIATATALEETLCVALSRRAVQIMIDRCDFETRTLIDFLIGQVQEHASGVVVDKDELARSHRILEILLNSPEQMDKLNKLEPFFVLLCRSLLDRTKRVMG